MKRRVSLSVVSTPKPAGTDLSALVGRWRSGVDVKLSKPSQVTKGPVKVVSSKARIKGEPTPLPDKADTTINISVNTKDTGNE